jgi:hypothetical protein
MLQTPREIAARFDRALESARIAEYVRPHYRRWLRFYLDFCAKYEGVNRVRGQQGHLSPCVDSD